tara:strand:- start:123 stop:590 length:468 start_codon:yes stop_codon:yes gene_type:complete
MKKKLILGTIILMLLSSCGFKIVNNQQLYNFTIIDVNTKGDNKIAFILKNNLKEKNNVEKNKVNLDIEIKKNKFIKEKNIQNNIKKYELSVVIYVKYKIDFSNKTGSFTVSKNGYYNVEDQYSKTINNENNLIVSLSNSLVDEIKLNITEITNDL